MRNLWKCQILCYLGLSCGKRMPFITKESTDDFTIKAKSHCLGLLSFSFQSFIRLTGSLTPFRGAKGNESKWFSNKPVSVPKYRPSMARRLVAYFLFTVCDATARGSDICGGKFSGVPMEPEGWVKTENTHLHWNVFTVPMYLWMYTVKVWEDLWCLLRGQTKSFLGDSVPHVRAFCELFQSRVMLASDCSYSCCSTSAAGGGGVAGLEHSTDPVMWVWLVSWLAGSEKLSVIMKLPLQKQPQWFFTCNKGTLKHFTVSAEKKHTAEIKMWQSVHLGE